MSRYFLYKEQTEYGCDYTIGCGIQLTEITAVNVDDAQTKVLKLFESRADDMEDYSGTYVSLGEKKLETVDLLVCDKVIDLVPFLEAKAAERAASYRTLEASEAEVAERRQYERLKAKYEAKYDR